MTPSYLSIGDEVIIVASAKKIGKQEMYAARDQLSSWGLRVRFGKHLFSEHRQLAGTDKERIDDLQEALNSHRVKAIFCARGGYGTSRIIDHLSLKEFRKYPKWVVGFSDITALHSLLLKQGTATLHATMPQVFHQPEEQESVASLQKFLFGKAPTFDVPFHHLNQLGTCQSEVVGGNLSLLVHSIGTPSDLSTDGKILFLEDVGEPLYHLDRMLVQMKRAGKLDKLAGLILGNFLNMELGTPPFEKDSYEVIKSHVANYSYPVGFQFPIGHQPPNLALPLGMQATLTVTENKTRLVYT